MATTRIMPLHIGKGRTESRAISKIIDYVANPEKTDHGRLITGYECDSRVADAEFMLAKRQYIAATGRVRGADDVIAYHVRQSFCPGEITPEEANRLGVEFAKRFTKGKHAFIVCTHIDKAHVHNHIIWSSVNLDCDRKFRNFWGSTKADRLEVLLAEERKFQQQIENIHQWANTIRRYLDLQELDREIVDELIDHIEVGERTVIDGKRYQDIKIFYRFVGMV